jgi:prepilin-type N-terminal cleavage/methylation domain-containing protein
MNMNTKDLPPNSRNGFTLGELLVVIVVVVMLAGMLFPALAASKSRSTAAGCLANLRQLQNAWAMYLDDNNDVMLPNAPAGLAANEAWCPTLDENWTGAAPPIDVNTNVSLYTNTLIFPYISSNITVLKCPADVLRDHGGSPRLRSYSMNGMMGAFYIGNLYNVGYLAYTNGSDLTCPSPANAFVFLDEHPDSISDGFLEVNSNPNGGFPDVPASYIEGGCGFSFADGHGEIHQWQTTNLMIPALYGVVVHFAPGGASNADWLWFTSHATCPQ